jgi:DNA-binding CsgD family transcriptional regulator
MLRFAKTATGSGSAPDTVADQDAEHIYDRYAGHLFRQALFTLDDIELAEQVVGDVIVGECVRPAVASGRQDLSRRLTVAAYVRCMELARSEARTSAGRRRRRAGACAACAGPDGLSARERGALGMVLFGGLEYRQVGADLGISAGEVAAILRGALVKAAAKPGTVPAAAREGL